MPLTNGYSASGTCSRAGYIGAGIGAGIGYLQGTLGLVIDALVSARLVIGSGDLVEVSKDSNPDLFWAIRGAGANFGIITSAVFKVTRQVDDGQIYYADVIYGPDQKVAYFELMEKLNRNFPSKLGFSSTIFWNGQTSQVCLLPLWHLLANIYTKDQYSHHVHVGRTRS
jgi:hypothetical protein